MSENIKSREDLQDDHRKMTGHEVLDKDIVKFLDEKHKDNLDELNNARKELLDYFDDLELRPELLQDKIALDLGSNKHFFDEYCKEKYNTNFVALDDYLEQLGTKHPAGVVADARSLPFKNEAFDLIISHAAMPHVLIETSDHEGNAVPLEGETLEAYKEDIFNFFIECYRVLKTDGQIRMSTFSEGAERSHIEDRRRNNLLPHITEVTRQQFTRIKAL